MARNQSYSNNVRASSVPDINFNAISYEDMIDWSVEISEPPLTADFSNDEFAEYIKTSDLPKLPSISLGATSLNNIPCHSQAVERNVKLVSEAAKKVIGITNRDGFVKCTIESRSNMPIFETKSDFNLN